MGSKTGAESPGFFSARRTLLLDFVLNEDLDNEPELLIVRLKSGLRRLNTAITFKWNLFRLERRRSSVAGFGLSSVSDIWLHSKQKLLRCNK